MAWTTDVVKDATSNFITNISADQKVQAFNFRMCLTKNAAVKVPIPAPKHYNASTWEIFRRYLSKNPTLKLSIKIIIFIVIFVVLSVTTIKNNFSLNDFFRHSGLNDYQPSSQRQD